MTLIVRRAGTADAAIVALLGRLTFRETFAALFFQYEDELRAYLDQTFAHDKIAESLGKPENNYWIASVDGLPVGYSKLKFPSDNPIIEAKAPAQLQKIYVLSEFVSRNVGAALMGKVLAEGARIGSDMIWLNVLSSNEGAIRFYERQHWTKAGDSNFCIGSQSFHFLTLRTSQGVNSAQV